MANNLIGCRNDKTTVVEPNRLFGETIGNNLSVPLEDLNIWVQLKATKKGRTVLTTSEEGGAKKNDNGVTINLFEGTTVGSKKFLTTQYTDLTTSLDKSSNTIENLGITNIDISFNASNTPLITIDFIDVRGSAVFQNEEHLRNNENVYSIFFQLPYPLYELTVKGYYGKPVKYCLHMTKFDSTFNSKTGNFEIKAQFIGYTYAMLSDLLIGYLKAIPYTEKGRDKYKVKNVITLDDLLEKISKINSLIEKVSSDDETTKTIAKCEEEKNTIDKITNEINLFGRELDVNDDSSDYSFIIMDDTKNTNTIITTFTKKINDLINEFNINSPASLKMDKIETFPIYNGLTIELLKNKDAESEIKLKSIFLIDGKATDDTFNNKVNSIINFITFRNFNSNKKFNLVDLNFLIDILNDRKKQLDKTISENTINLAKKLQATIVSEIDLDTTIKNIMEILTTAGDVFLETMHDVSVAAETNSNRKSVLKQKFSKEKFNDYKKNDDFYPWPDYSEIHNNAVTEKYIGESGTGLSASNMDELKFIDDLYQAFITSQTRSETNQIALINNETNWIPINPIDTRIFNNVYPYERIEGLTKSEIIGLIVVRAMTFLGYSNSSTILKDEEIETMAKSEANNVLKFIKDGTPKQSLGNASLQDFTGAFGTVNDRKNIPILKKNGNLYEYDYILNGSDLKIIPINNNFGVGSKNVFWSYNTNELVKNRDDKQLVFLTNYNSRISSNAVLLTKLDDGGIYVKMKSPSEFNNKQTKKDKFNIDITTDSVLDLNDLKSDTFNGVGFNAFGGSYGIQEFKDLNYNNEDLDGLPLRYIFYRDNEINGLGKNPLQSVASNYKFENPKNSLLVKNTLNTTTISLINNSKFLAIDTTGVNDVIKNNYDSYGKTRFLFNKIDNSVTYPFINNRGFNATTNKVYSLFGTTWYYNQSTDDAKAYLFLNMLPWNQGDITFLPKEIKRLFNQRAGFIHAPRLWVAYVGSLLWRAESVTDPISWDITISGNTTLIAPELIDMSDVPAKDQILSPFNTSLLNNIIYRHIPDLLTLPDQVKNEFKNVFFDFVQNINDFGVVGWSDIKNGLEIVNGGGATFLNALNVVYGSLTPLSNGNYELDKQIIFNNFINVDRYDIISPVLDDKFRTETPGSQPKYTPNSKKYLFLELKDDFLGNESVRTLINAMKEEIIISNSTPFIWDNDLYRETNGLRRPISVDQTKLETYFKIIISKFKEQTQIQTDNDKIKRQEIFGTSDENVIKLQLYKTCKNIYDKWIGGNSVGQNILYKCGVPTNGDINSNLIDSFRFMDSSLNEIGDKFYLNPIPIQTFLTDNPNASLYNLITTLLSYNNFDFHPLPTFINYNDEKEIKSMFDIVGPSEKIKDTVCGPSFVCVYVGKTSKNLDFKDSEYNNDGFDLNCDKGALNSNAPYTFSTDDGDRVPVFVVSYSQQNQNIFKDVNITQTEFSVTDETLKIVNNISNLGSDNNRAFVGQNIYDVYGSRSYRVDIEMMGNAMIQPLTYFQLNNIPMFHGAYMIDNVKHNIKPNFMTTTFGGRRIRNVKTKLIEAPDVYMNLLRSLGLTTVTSVVMDDIKTKNQIIGDNKQYGPYVNYQVEENDGLKYQERNNVNGGVKFAQGDDWAMEEVGRFMQTLATNWYQKYKNDDTVTSVLYVNSFGAQGGGSYKKHGKDDGRSSHDIGLACDFRFILNKNINKVTTYDSNDGLYNQNKTIELIQDAINLANSNEWKDQISIQDIIFNDPVVISTFPSLVSADDGHNNHIHIEFDVPPRVIAAINSKDNIQGDEIVTSLPAGSVGQNKGKLPTESEIINSIGKI